ncbi:hypothetical protein CK203_044356 [Vitis vinifera]|uniref:Uncharacterized protein n=1 Tax=Vitis vinifera TaxID=29760 RepID=A0A438H7X1_VITVI|nr:hypothetical protein CK203_044356 [Vitis vinifera]
MWSPRFGCSSEGEDRKEAWVRILESSNLAVGAVDSEESGGRVRQVLRHRSSNGKEGGLGMGKDPGKAEWRGLAEFDGDRGGGGGICRVFVVGDSAGNKEKNRGMAEMALGGREGRSGVVVTHVRDGVWEKAGRWTQGTTSIRGRDGRAGGRGEGGGEFENWAHLGRVTWQSFSFAGNGSSSSGSGFGLVGLKRDSGPTTQGPPLSKGAELAATGIERTEDDLGLKLEMEFIKCREKEVSGKQLPALQCSMAERVIVDEALRYGSFSNLRGEPPERKQDGARSYGGATASREGCWDLIEINCDALEVQNPEWTPVLTGSQVLRSEKETNWEESSLAKFSKLLGFSIEGLEREILDFLSKIRKRRERIHNKGLLEKSKFERELKRVGRFLDWRTLEAAGAAGSVLICWDKRSLEMLEWEEGQFSISYKFRTVENVVVWGVHGWGDFNVILSQGERSKQGRVTSAMRRFAQVMDDLELFGLPLQGGSFTWSGGLHNQAWARLDRFMVSPSWLDQFSNVTQKRLSRPISDHFPIIIEGGDKRRGPLPFRFENMWLKVKGLKTLCGVGGRGCQSVEEVQWRQKSRVKWIKEGDCNSKFFHRVATGRRSRKFIKSLIFERGETLNNIEIISEEIVNFFGNLYSKPEGLIGRLRKVLHETIFGSQGAFVEEILDAVLVANEVVDEKRRSCASKEGVQPEMEILDEGDPLSPFLFTLVADVLSRLMIRAEETGITEGFLVGRDRTRVSLLQFADDTIFFSKASLDLFKTLRLSFWFLGKVSEWPLSYLGLPLGGNPKTISFWDPVVERISRRLDGWKKAYMSLGGRITLIQSCLSHIPSYFISLFKIPVSIASKIEKMQRDFLWSGAGKGRKIT